MQQFTCKKDYMNFFKRFDHDVQEHLILMETTKYHELSTSELKEAIHQMEKNYSYYNDELYCIKKVNVIFSDAISDGKIQPNNHIEEEYKKYKSLYDLTQTNKKKGIYERILYHLGFVMKKIDFSSNACLYFITFKLDNLLTECIDSMKIIGNNINYYTNLLDKKIKYQELHRVIQKYHSIYG